MPDLAREISSINFGSIIGGSLNAIVEAQCQSANTTVNFIRSVGFYPGEDGGIGKPIYVSFHYDKEVSPYQSGTKAAYQITVEKGGAGYKSGGVKLSVGKSDLPCSVVLDGTGAIVSATLTGACSVPATTPLTITATEGSGSELTLVVTPAVPAQPAQVDRMLLQVPVLTMLPIPFIKIEEATIDFNVKINSVTTTERKEDSSYGGSLDVSTSFSFWRFKTTAKLNATLSNQKNSSNSEEVKRDYSLNIHIKAVQDDMPAGTARLLDILEDSIASQVVEPAKTA